ncbi:hypothetical protein ACH5RR_030524 [Cinchona calisaya]|uniref:Uncharacterized protein n=1 Tax=Cinchona calisaya TaxID=153742 RepID=A0ABD2YUW5_9GENT
MLDKHVQDRILEACRMVLRRSGFRFYDDWASLFSVTFVSDEPLPPEYSRNVKYGNFTYKLYGHSFLQFGQKPRPFMGIWVSQGIATEEEIVILRPFRAW